MERINFIFERIDIMMEVAKHSFILTFEGVFVALKQVANWNKDKLELEEVHAFWTTSKEMSSVHITSKWNSLGQYKLKESGENNKYLWSE